MTAVPLPSIRQRLSRVLVLVSVAWGAAVSVVVWLAVRHEVDDLLDETLMQSGEIIFGLLAAHRPPASTLPAAGGAAEPLVWQLVDPAQGVVLRSRGAPAQPLLAQRTRGFATVGSQWRVYAMPFDTGGRMFYVAQRGDERREARLEVATVTAAAALVVGLLCALWLRLRVRRELLPIDAFSAAVSHYDPLQPGEPLAPATRTELLPLREAVQGLGSSLARRLTNERAFSAHAAHALRTPLAGLVAQLAVAQRRSPPEALPTLQRARMAADRLRRVVDALLALFRSGAEVQRQRVDLAELTAHLPFETLVVDVEAGATVQADPDLLAAGLLNLLDNAVRHGAGKAALGVRPGALWIHDDGSGIAAAERERMQAALDGQHYGPPVGLGLTLADLVARAHGGRLRLLPAAQGCLVELGLGAAPPAL